MYKKIDARRQSSRGYEIQEKQVTLVEENDDRVRFE